MGKSRNDIARLRAGESAAESALRMARQTSAESPDEERALVLLSKAYEYSGYMEGALGENTSDRSYFDRAAQDIEANVAIIERLYAANPAKYRRYLPDSQGDLSSIRLRAGDTASAERLARESLRRFEEISAGDQRNAEAARDVMVAHWRLAKALAQEKRDSAAAAEFSKTVAGFEQLRRQNASEPYDNVITESRDRIAAYRLAAGNAEAARKLWRENIDMLKNSAHAPDQVALALDYELLGKATAMSDSAQARTCYQGAAQIWEQLRDLRKLPPLYAGKADEMRRAAANLAASAIQ